MLHGVGVGRLPSPRHLALLPRRRRDDHVQRQGRQGLLQPEGLLRGPQVVRRRVQRGPGLHKEAHQEH